jgi:uncharacterized repeat protein (TIGR03803 family)
MTYPRLRSLISGIRLRITSITFAVLLGVLATQSAPAQTYTVLHAFQGVPDGALPVAGLVLDVKGSLYGTTESAGDSSCQHPYGCGVVFKIDTTGTETVLFRFGHGRGDVPQAGLVRDPAGNLYGTTSGGGHFLAGTVFRLGKDGKQKVLHSFDRQNGSPGGSFPGARVLRDSTGNLFGTTVNGGNSSDSGVVFKLNKFGKETVLYAFTCPICYGKAGGGFGVSDSGVIRDAAGNLYGIAAGGTVTNGCTYGCGVVYKVDKNHAGTVFYSFTGGSSDGAGPNGNLTKDAAGNLYGTTYGGGGNGCNNNGCGTVFKVDPSGHETLLYRFTGTTDGTAAAGGVARDPQGNLYGTTSRGGDPTCDGGFGCGVVFKIDPNGNETTLHTFTGGTDGESPNPDLIRDAAGNLYGTTFLGGDPTCHCGVVFKITP